MIQRYQLKPVEYDAEQFTGVIPGILLDENQELAPSRVDLGVSPDSDAYTHIEIDGHIHVGRGDWIVRGRSGSTFSIYGDQEFRELFSPVEADE